MSADTLTWKQLVRKLKQLTPFQILLLSALVTLLPIAVGLLLWSRMPEQIGIYIDPDLRPDAWIHLPLAIFLPPAVLLLGQLVTFFLVKRSAEASGSSLRSTQLPVWILPIVSNLFSYMTYALAMGSRYYLSSYFQLILGLFSVFLGKYLPGIRPNSPFGIRIPWTFSSRHNWRATHRFGGFCWMIGGFFMVLTAFVPSVFANQIILALLLAELLLPVAFSFVYYLRQKANGDPLHRLPTPGRGLMLALALLAVLSAVLLLTGSLDYRFHEDHLQVKASYYEDFFVDYQDIQHVEFHSGNVDGKRIGGFFNLRLQTGFYYDEVQEITYTRYTYFHPDACVILTLPDRILVLSGKNQVQTQELYTKLLEKTEN